MLSIILTNFALLFIAWFGIFLPRQHILIILIALEIILLGININFICFSLFYDDLIGQLYGISLLTIAAAESSIGLSLLVVYYRLRGGIAASLLTLLKS